ncbi:MAG: efflux RND transporter permease subunit [Candidatus Hydrogenedentes bacterium]|nr:efflux RND transporter permease subunit [Candidatus Hydrogenedentota bacterium]
MNNFNLTDWALKHRQIVLYFVAVVFVGGAISYMRLGRMEDPDFTIRKMIVAVVWPGASARDVEEQLTDKLEKKLQDTPGLDYLDSYSYPGKSVIYVTLKDDAVTGDQVRPVWLEVRNMVNDIWYTLPQGVIGPFFNDRFDDVFGCIYALTSDGFSMEEMRAQMERIRRIALAVPGVRKADLVGVQPEKVYIEIDNAKLAQFGVDPGLVLHTIQAQNAMTPSGMIETSTDNVYLRVTGIFDTVDSLRDLPIRVGGMAFRLSDVAKIERAYAEPAEPKFFFNGRPAIGLAISMEKGGNILTLGKNLDAMTNEVKDLLPKGMELSTVANQPEVVKESIDEFVKSLAEAVGIVLIVSFISLGLRSGVVVALCIPMVIAGVFVVMSIIGIDLHKISLGALIIALGLLVDDAIIAIEMMIVKLEQGWDRSKAASFAYTATAYPRLTGALVTCAGFIPVGFSKGTASEFVGSIFSVVTIALLISWLAAGAVTPLLGHYLVRVKHAAEGGHADIYDTRFYRLFRSILAWCLRHRSLVLAVTALCFLGSLFLMGKVQQEFFPASTRPELLVDLRLPQGASMEATEERATAFAQRFQGDPNIESCSLYVGVGAPRFVLTSDPVHPDSNFAQVIFVAKDLETRVALSRKIKQTLESEFLEIQSNIKVIQTGPPNSYPVMLRVSGYDHDKVRDLAQQVCEVMRTDPNLWNVNLNWHEKSKIMRVAIDQDKARMQGIDSQTLALTLQTFISGADLSEYREQDRTVDIVFRVGERNRTDLSKIKDLSIPIGNGKSVALDQIATIAFEAEDGLIRRRNLKPTITVQANTIDGVLGNDATTALLERLSSLRASLPPGYSISIGGPLEDSIKASNWLMQPVPAMLAVILTLLMFQLKSIPKMFLTLFTAPLGIIGVSISLLLTGRPMGFVVQLGILALAGIIMRNSVILIDQIDQQLAAGQSPWDAVLNATVLRFRPIMLTAAAAILGMIPLVSSVFWGPMAVAIAGGLFVATLLTLIVLPTMYVTVYRVRPAYAAGELPAVAEKDNR